MTMTMTEPTTQVATRVQYQPLAPVGSALNLKNLLDTQKASLSQALPKHVTPDRIIKTLLVAANRTPDLLQCTQASVLETINRAGELGLDLSGTLGEAYPVPFNNRVKVNGREEWVKQCQLIIGYRGLAKLARQSGEIKRIESEVVYQNDQFRYRKGTTFILDFEPKVDGERGEPIGAYALVEFKDGGLQAEFMAVSDIDKIRLRSKSGSDKEGRPIGAWKSDWAEMAKKTVFRRLAKWMPLSAEKFNAALEQDAVDYDLQNVVSVEPTQPPKSLAARLGVQTDADQLQQPAESTAQDTGHDDAAGASATDTTDSDEPAGADNTTAGAAAEATAAPASEAPPLPDKWNQAVAAQAEKHGVTIEQAHERLAGFAAKVLKVEPAKLTEKQLDDLLARAKRGDIKHVTK